jgi:hypothetical protein
MPLSNATRIVSRNLLVSASQALADAIFDQNRITESNFRDLCTLINLSILYDGVEVLGSHYHLDRQNKPMVAEGYESIEQLTGLSVDAGPKPEELDAVVLEASKEAAAPFFTVANISRDEIMTRLRGSIRTELSDAPDYWDDFNEGRQLALGGTFKGIKFSPAQAAENFWYRTFLYLGLARVRRIPFVPDAVRGCGFPTTGRDSGGAYDQLINAVQAKWGDQLAVLLQGTEVQIPPFAAVIFHRAGSDRSRIGPELRALREELGEVRSALLRFDLEKKAGSYGSYLQGLFPTNSTAAVRSEVDRRVQEAIANLYKQKVPLPRFMLKLRPLLSVIYETYLLVHGLLPGEFESLKKAGLEIMQAFPGIWSDLKEYQGFDESNAFAEVHYRLGWDLRSWFNTEVPLEKLFGQIQPDLPERDAARA